MRSTRGLNGDLPAFVTNAEAAASGAELIFLCLDHARRRPSSRLTAPSSSTSRARTGCATPRIATRWYGVAPGAWSYGLPEVSPPEGRLIANPGCYATAALLALAPLAGVIDGAVVVDAKSGMTGAGRGLKDGSHAGFVLENFSAVRGRLAPARTGDRAGARLPRHVRPPPPADPARPARDVLRRVGSPTLRALLEAAYAGSEVVRVLPGA